MSAAGVAVPRALALLVLVVTAIAAHAGGPGLLLVAKPGLPDPNFARTVLVVAQDERGAALGVVLNRPADVSLAQLMDNDPRVARFTEPMYLGGPVERVGLFAVFRADRPPGPALQIADDLWLALGPETLEQLLADPPAQLRLYAGYAGWAPGQLAAEIDRGSWWVLDPDPDVVFRRDTRGLWDELAARANTVRTRHEPGRAPPLIPASFALGR
jgi:putative transcriptional regulator